MTTASTSAPLESLRTDLTSWEIGPYHGALPGPMRLKLRLDGEIIISGEVETGYLYRGLEKAIELHPWHAAIAYADHLDPEGGVFGELALALAVEEIGSFEVPARAQRIRVILCELTRISRHMGYIVRMARSVGAETIVHYVLRDRERVLDLFELLTGARFSLNFLRFGGVAADVTEGFIERVLDVCDLIRVRIKEYNDLFTFHHSYMKRTAGVGVISTESLRALGITGPNARAAGHKLDVRKEFPYTGYRDLDFEIPVGRGERGARGDVHDRFLVRLREIEQSVHILRQSVESIPSGEFASMRVGDGFAVPAGGAYARIESSRGLLGCHVVSDGALSPHRVQFRPPSTAHLLIIPELVCGIRIEDLPVVLASVDIGIAEADR
jgi:NADH-quinone oxidoreductase subunit D